MNDFHVSILILIQRIKLAKKNFSHLFLTGLVKRGRQPTDLHQ